MLNNLIQSIYSVSKDWNKKLADTMASQFRWNVIKIHSRSIFCQKKPPTLVLIIVPKGEIKVFSALCGIKSNPAIQDISYCFHHLCCKANNDINWRRGWKNIYRHYHSSGFHLFINIIFFLISSVVLFSLLIAG